MPFEITIAVVFYTSSLIVSLNFFVSLSPAMVNNLWSPLHCRKYGELRIRFRIYHINIQMLPRSKCNRQKMYLVSWPKVMLMNEICMSQ